MPSGYAPVAQGPTPSAPANVAVGAAIVGGSNSMTISQQGADVAGLAAGITLVFQWIKQNEKFDQQVWASIALLVLGVVSAYVVFVIIGHKPPEEAIPKGCWMAWQAFENYIGQKATGLGGLPPANS